MTLEQTVNIEGNLRDAYKQAVPGTLKHVDELMQERRDNPELRKLGFCTPDGSVYSMDGKTPTLRITRGPVNPILNHIDDAFDQLVNAGNYKVLRADFEAVKAAADTVTLDLTKLGLQRENENWSYLAVDTSTAITEYDNEQQKLLRRVFGPTDKDYTANMNMLRESLQQIKETRVYVLDPQYVKKHVKSPIARASWLDGFDKDSSFYAVIRFIYGNCRLRGVCKKSSNDLISAPESDMLSDSVRRRASDSELQGTAGAPKNGSAYRTAAENGFKVHYDTILADPESAVKAMDDKILAGILGLASRYAPNKIR